MILTTPSELSWTELLEAYLFAHNLRPATEISYTKELRSCERFFGTQSYPSALTHLDVLRWRRYVLNEQKLSPNTWNRKMTHLRALFNYGMEQQTLPQEINPFNKTVVRADKKQKKTLEKSQLNAAYLRMNRHERDEKTHPSLLLKSALSPSSFWLTVLDTLRYTGIRINQLRHLRLKDIYLARNEIELRVISSKTHRAWRVPIVAPLRGRLANLMEQATILGMNQDDFLFDPVRFKYPHLHSSQYSYDEHKSEQLFSSFFKRLSKECNFAISPHRFRHTLATELMKAPERNLPLVKNLLGHTSVATTLEYINLDVRAVGQVLEKELKLFTDIYNEETELDAPASLR